MLNSVTLIGNLGQDPELRRTQSGEAVCSLSVATNERWKDRDGTQQERTEWHKVVVWGAQAETCAEHLAKGRKVCILGSLQTRKWKDKDGADRWTTEIKAQRVIFLDRAEGRGGRGDGGYGDGYGGGRRGDTDQGGGGRRDEGGFGGGSDGGRDKDGRGFGEPDDDIPF